MSGRKDEVMPLWIWGFILDGVGLTAAWFLSSRNRLGWMISMVAQILWTIYSIQTKQWGFFPGITIQSYVNLRGWRKWSTA